MAYYLVRAKPKPERLRELRQQLEQNAFVGLRPFGKALTHSLENARSESDGTATWEEEDYCSPPWLRKGQPFSIGISMGSQSSE